jgi:hypothetical protein
MRFDAIDRLSKERIEVARRPDDGPAVIGLNGLISAVIMHQVEP